MKSFVVSAVLAVASFASQSDAFSLSMQAADTSSSRRAFLTKATAGTAAVVAAATTSASPALAGPQIYSTPTGVKYAILKEPQKKGASPQQGDIVAIEYTGYLTDGRIFDATHQEGKQNALLFKFGSDTIIQGLTDVIQEMSVGQKVQAIIPASLAFGEKGICIESGECLVKPGSTLVYDVFLKKSSIPPP